MRVIELKASARGLCGSQLLCSAGANARAPPFPAVLVCELGFVAFARLTTIARTFAPPSRTLCPAVLVARAAFRFKVQGPQRWRGTALLESAPNHGQNPRILDYWGETP